MNGHTAPIPTAAFTLHGRPAGVRWAALLLPSAVLIALLQLLHLPAAWLLGALGAAILLASYDGKVAMPRWPYVLAQGVVGCLVARSIGRGILETLLQRWPVFITCITSVLVISAGLGALLARWRVLPGSTAVWGSAPGAATVMVLMSAGFGADSRLVAYMQFLRVVLVAVLASVIARLWPLLPRAAAGTHVAATQAAALHALSHAPAQWFSLPATGPLLGTLALAMLGAFAGRVSKIPAGPLLLPMCAGIALSSLHMLTITLPPWLLAVCYVIVGWNLGQGFTREVMTYAARVFPRILASTLALIVLCGGLAAGLHLWLGTDALTAYLATSPGGADSVAIIASSSNVDLPFVMAMQTARFVLIIVLGPALARLVARWTM